MVGARSGLWHHDKYQDSPSLSPTTFSLNEDLEFPLYHAYGPSNTGYELSTPYGPTRIELGEMYMVLPGHGTKKHNCGEVRFAIACSNDACRHEHGFHLRTENCGRMTCPTCRESAIDRAAARAVERIEGLTAAYEEEGQRLGPISHCQLSTSPDSPLFSPEALSTREGLDRAYQKARESAQKALPRLWWHSHTAPMETGPSGRH